MAQDNSFDSAYEGAPPWDIGRPQKEIVRLAEAGKIEGEVIDVGCGTGENALFLAALGRTVLGVDSATLALEKAEEKAAQRGLTAAFLRWDALQLASLGRTFDTAIDFGLFHVFSDDDRAAFVSNLAALLRQGGVYHMICFSEHEPGDWGPRRVTQAEIRRSFDRGWRIEDLQEAVFETNRAPGDVRAWLSSIRKL